MAIRKIFEAEADGPSVIIWENGRGTRVVYFSEQQAESAAHWLVERANQFHKAKEKNDGTEHESMVTAFVYGEEMTEFQFVRRFIDLAYRAGYEIIRGLERPAKEFW